jgi:hypothetical protein
VAQEELKGQVALASRNAERGLRILQSASRKERALRYSEPTNYPRPVIEVLAQAALRNGKLELAKASFQQALDQNPASPLKRSSEPSANGKGVEGGVVRGLRSRFWSQFKHVASKSPRSTVTSSR